VNPTEPTSSAKPAFGPATAVLELAVSGRWRAPETTAALADHAAAQARARSDPSSALLAEGWLVHGLAVAGRGAAAVPRAVAALEEAVRLGHRPAEARLRVGLASVARELGDQDSAWALLASVVEHDIVDPELGADAHIEAVRCGGRGADGLLAAADLAVGCVRRLRGEQVELGLAALDAALAGRHRIAGRARAAAARAREGLRRLLGDSGAGSELDPISPHIAAWLNLELTLALFDDGQPDAARRVAEPALSWAGRPAALPPLTRLRLVLAQRAYLPAGEHEAALRAVGWAAGAVGDQDLPGLEADCQHLLAEVHERRGALPDALTASRRAHQALRLHSARVEQALVLLGRCAGGSRGYAAPTPADRAWGGSAPAMPFLAEPDPRSTSSPPPSLPPTIARSAPPPPSPPPPSPPPPSPSPPSRPEQRPASAAPGAPPSSAPVPAPSPLSASSGPASENGYHSGATSATLRLPVVPIPAADPIPGPPPTSWPTPIWPEDENSPAAGPRATMGPIEPTVADEPWSALTGWPEEPRTSSAPTFGAGPRSRPDQATPFSDGDAVADTFSYRLAPEEHAEPYEVQSSDRLSGFEALGLEPDRYSVPHGDVPGAAPDQFDAAVLDGHGASDELDEVFDPDEDRPLGLVALDVATPTGPLTGAPARPLLERVAEHVRGQLPPNSRLRVLARDVVLIVLPPVEPDVVARWMRSLAGGLSASWAEYAADVPRSAFRVAVGTLEPGRAVGDTVAELCDRLSLQPTSGGGPGGRHVARGQSTVDIGPGQGGTESRSGRRRRPESEAGSATNGSRSVPGIGNGPASGGSKAVPGSGAAAGPQGATARMNGVAPGTNGAAPGANGSASNLSGRTNGAGPNASGGASASENGFATGARTSRNAGIDRTAVARLSQMALSPPVTAHVNGTHLNGMHVDGTHVNGAASERVALSAAATTALAVSPTDPSTDPEELRAQDLPRTAETVTRPEPVAELSFAELLAGALCAYRDG
jgi:hypothetical protein